MPPTKRLHFLQDNVKLHWTPECREALREKNVTGLEHPTYSPDMNPPEELFALADREMTVKAGTEGLPSSIAESKARWVAACESVCAVGSVKKMQEHLPDVMKACIENKGGPTRY